MNGVILGRFMPPHNGHLFLVDFARAMVDHLYILVCTLSSEIIPGETRFQWMQELAPHCTVLHITQEIPQAHRDSPQAPALWAQAIHQAVPGQIDRVFASEPYGHELARHLKAQFIPLDPSRSNIPVSASMIREDPWTHWEHLPPPVRPWFLRRVAVIGNPALAESLAAALRTVTAHPYQEFLRTFGNSPAFEESLSEDDCARANQATLAALARRARRVIFQALPAPEDLENLPSQARPHLIIADQPLYHSGSAFLQTSEATAETVERILISHKLLA
ncbi:nicotinamide-nucleotide adenylyltransferase, NadR type [Alkalispirochaeta americana]|uniref:Nicotinamide-nucleotide adenylyltransferase, NadR type n=2 Tax=Alkalispirochaeta americana TaxID=159291 RepID=A0A1N6QA44_9SPIO|nr:nicotinamide-nucleotide adenylyltransferase, NadR type [Alkalispirochaeta americana]